MSTKTTNYELVKPELTDVADITAMNPNWDKLDENIKMINDTNGYLETKIGEKYVKPSSGIPKTDLTSEVQESLAKANSAIQVEEMGNSGIWTYVKYSNGIAECWGSKTEVNHTFETAWGTTLYISSAFEAVDYPFAFIERPVEHAIIRSSGGTGITYGESGGTGLNTATHTARYNCARPDKTAKKFTFTIDYIVRGKWK